MKNYIKLSLALLISTVITSCVAPRLDLTKISIGMDKPTVITNLRKAPDSIIGAKKYPNGAVEVVQYSSFNIVNGHPEYTWLYFYNSKLMQFGRPNGDWEYTADQIAADNGNTR